MRDFFKFIRWSLNANTMQINLSVVMSVNIRTDTSLDSMDNAPAIWHR